MGGKKRRIRQVIYFAITLVTFFFYLTACSVKPTFLVKHIYCFVDNKVCKKKFKKKENTPKTNPHPLLKLLV